MEGARGCVTKPLGEMSTCHAVATQEWEGLQRKYNVVQHPIEGSKGIDYMVLKNRQYKNG